jgi:hypothetical protein
MGEMAALYSGVGFASGFMTGIFCGMMFDTGLCMIGTALGFGGAGAAIGYVKGDQKDGEKELRAQEDAEKREAYRKQAEQAMRSRHPQQPQYPYPQQAPYHPQQQYQQPQQPYQQQQYYPPVQQPQAYYPQQPPQSGDWLQRLKR